MQGIHLVLGSIALLGSSGSFAFLLRENSTTGQRITTIFTLLGALTGIAGIALSCIPDSVSETMLPWFLPWGCFSVRIDALSRLFLLPVFIIPALGSIYGLGYWKQAEHPKNGKQLGFFYGVLAASMAMVVIARDGVLFLIVWEIMALSAFFAATVEDEHLEVQKAGWIYLVATHVGTLCLIAMFALWRYATGSFALEPVQEYTVQVAGVLFILSLVGFGCKAGIIPLHVWLPGAHANAPSHVSAVMSGVMLKMGIYGIVRITSLMPQAESWWGMTMLIVGIVTGIAGIIYAIGQNDIKRILAYSSIENIGIICMGIGLALIGKAIGRYEWVLLGMGGALLHVINHALFKSLLFFNAGIIIHATGTREIEHMGGLGRKMPLIMMLFIVGSVAICALPPLNGFVSEWFIYLGFFKTLMHQEGQSFSFIAPAAVALALIGPLAIVCFVRLLGAVFLGTPRGVTTNHVHFSPLTMVVPIIFLAAMCAGIGIVPAIVIDIVQGAVYGWLQSTAPVKPLAVFVPVTWISVFGAVLFASVMIVAVKAMRKGSGQETITVSTWDCGYAKPTNAMQYTASSFGEPVMKLFGFITLPVEREPDIRGCFPGKTSFRFTVPDLILERIILPLSRRFAASISRFRFLHKGLINMYVLYILAILFVFLLLR